MYDALVSLEKGNLLTKAGDMALGMHLEGVHEVSHVFEIMKKGGYLRQLIPEKIGTVISSTTPFQMTASDVYAKGIYGTALCPCI